MGKQVLLDARLFVAGADLSGVSNKIEIQRQRAAVPVTNYMSGGSVELLGGLESGAVAAEGYFDPGTNVGSDQDPAVDANLGVVGPWTIAPFAANDGVLAYVYQALEGDFTILGKVGDAAAYQANAVKTGPRARGRIGHPPGTARTANGTGSSQQLGAVSASQKLYANLHVLSVAGTSTPTLTARIESDDATGFPSPITRGTFTAATAVGGQSMTIAGPITDDWWRIAWTITGTTPSFLFLVSFGIA